MKCDRGKEPQFPDGKPDELKELKGTKCFESYTAIMKFSSNLSLKWVCRLEPNKKWVVYVGNTKTTITDVVLAEISPLRTRTIRCFHFRFKKFNLTRSIVPELSKHMIAKIKLIEGLDRI